MGSDAGFPGVIGGRVGIKAVAGGPKAAATPEGGTGQPLPAQL